MGHVNIEIKARVKNLNRVREILKSKNAEFRGVDHQIDTYFKINSGRLKLREGNIENYLIYYKRENKSGPKQSDVVLLEFDPKSSLKAILLSSMEILVVVDKKREIYFIDNVKFHIDDVDELGTFVEIEAIDKMGDIGRDKLLEQCQFFLDLLGIEKDDLISDSYSDLLLKK